MPAYREEAANVTLAAVMTRLGAPSNAETIVKSGKSKKYPDVRTEWAGISIVIEAKYAGAGAADEVTVQVEERLEDALGELGVALLYPADIKTAPDLEAALENATLMARFAAPGRLGQWQELAGVEDLIRCLDFARALLIDDDAVKDSAQGLADAIGIFERAVAAQPARRDALLQVVSAVDAAGAGTKDLDKARRAATAISGLSLLTAAMLQNELARVDPAVPKPPTLVGGEERQALIESWKKVLERDYAAIFQVALRVLEELADEDLLSAALRNIQKTAGKIAASRALGRHDLVGRVYHTLLADKKFLATYFTSVPAATVLAGLALQADRWDEIDWGRDPADGPPIEIGDLACGTGTLLLSSAAAVRRNWASARAEQKTDLDLPGFGKSMIEDGIEGYDVLAYALQVCAATLLLGAPGAAVEKTGLYRMPFGGPGGRLGSLEFLTGKTEAQLWGDEVGHAVDLDDPQQGLSEIALPELDLCIMNPPFTRSVGGSQLLGSLGGQAFKESRKRLGELCKRPDVQATLTAGLGAPFVELARRVVKSDGRLALVLPKAVLTGDAWAQTRALLSSDFHVEYVVTAHEAGQWNFSDSTDLSEALIVCRKTQDEGERAKPTQWIALSENPDTAIEAFGVLAAIRKVGQAPKSGVSLTVSNTLGADVGEAFSRPAPKSGAPWRHGTFSRSVLDQAAEALLSGDDVPLPRAAKPLRVPLRPVSEVGTIGYDRRDVTDAFEKSAVAKGYPALWGQDAQKMLTMEQSATAELSPRSAPAPGRKRIKDKEQVWAGAGRLMISERLWAVTYRTTAVALADRALSNTSWSVNLHDEDPNHDHAVALWLNSSLGILGFLNAAEETRGPWVAMKKNKLKALPILDFANLAGNAKEVLADGWAEARAKPLQAISELGRDPVRERIDEIICTALDLDVGAVGALRELLSSEPRFAPVPKKKKRGTVATPQRQLF